VKHTSIGLVFLLGLLDCGGQGVTATPDAGTPDAGGGPLSLAPGEVAEITVDGSGVSGERLATPTGTEKFVLVLASTKFVVQTAVSGYTLSLDAAPDAPSSALVTGCALSTSPWSTTTLPSEPPPTGTAPAVGTTRDISVPTGIGAEVVSAKVIASGNSAVVWADTTVAHPAVLDTTFVQQFLDDFEKTIMPRERSVFGTESDLDADGHIQLMFSPLTKDTAVAFFTGCDLKGDLAGCSSTNGGEFLYLTPPGNIDPPYNTPNAMKEILAHEASHMIHFGRKVLRNKLTKWTDSGYMIEGVGGFAQDAVGYQAGNLYVTMAGLDGFDQFSLGDTLVDNRPYDTKRDGVLRGGSYLFVRYLYDRAGGDKANSDGTVTGLGGPAFIHAAFEDPRSIAGALPDLTKASLADIGVDFFTTLAMSNREDKGGPAPKNACFAYLPTSLDPVSTDQRGTNVYAKFHGIQMKGPAIQLAASADGKLRAGGVEYIELDAVPGQPELDFTATLDPSILPRVRVGRIQ
jgi:hypothetical protein